MVQNRWLRPILYSGNKKSNFTGEHGGVSVHCWNVILKPWCVRKIWHLRSWEAYQDNFTTTVTTAAIISVGGEWVWRYPDWITLLKKKKNSASICFTSSRLSSVQTGERETERERNAPFVFALQKACPCTESVSYPSPGAESGSGTDAYLWYIFTLKYQFIILPIQI